LKPEPFIQKSAALLLFWTRIMKEHAIFIGSSLSPVRKQDAAQAEQFRLRFDRFLRETIRLTEGVLPAALLSSGQFYTDYTEAAERDFQRLMGYEVNGAITAAEREITPAGQGMALPPQLGQSFSALSRRVLEQLGRFIRYQEILLKQRNECVLYFGLYPSALEHLMKEAKQFEKELNGLLEGGGPGSDETVAFWNRGMSEHAKSLRGQLDWTEETWFRAADSFAAGFDRLAAAHPERAAAAEYLPHFYAYATDTTRTLLECRLKGIMSSLYCDHLLREVNHYGYQLWQPDFPPQAVD
jgi:hypothetical protein